MEIDETLEAYSPLPLARNRLGPDVGQVYFVRVPVDQVGLLAETARSRGMSAAELIQLTVDQELDDIQAVDQLQKMIQAQGFS